MFHQDVIDGVLGMIYEDVGEERPVSEEMYGGSAPWVGVLLAIKTVSMHIGVKSNQLTLVNNTYKADGDYALANINPNSESGTIVNSLPDPIVDALKGFQATTPRLFTKQILMGNNSPKFEDLLKKQVFENLKGSDLTLEELLNIIQRSKVEDLNNTESELAGFIAQLTTEYQKTIRFATPLWADTLAVAAFIYHRNNEGIEDPGISIMYHTTRIRLLTNYLKSYVKNVYIEPVNIGGSNMTSAWLAIGSLAAVTLIASCR